MIAVTTATKDALRVLAAYTAGRFDLWALAGGPRASSRAHVMSILQGRRVPQAQSGVTALRSAFYEALGVTGDCEAIREDDFIEKARATAGR